MAQRTEPRPLCLGVQTNQAPWLPSATRRASLHYLGLQSSNHRPHLVSKHFSPLLGRLKSSHPPVSSYATAAALCWALHLPVLDNA